MATRGYLDRLNGSKAAPRVCPRADSSAAIDFGLYLSGLWVVAGSSMKRPRVLVVDDDETLRMLMIEVLKGAGFDAAGASGGAQGIQLAIKDRPDVVISDVCMPDVDGVEFLTKLKEAKVGTRFIFVTGVFTDLRDTVKFVKLGACDVIHKPFDVAKLESAVKRALALESALSLNVSDPAPLIKNILAEADAIHYERQRLTAAQEQFRIAKRDTQWQVVLIRLLYLLAAGGVTVLFYRLHVISSNAQLFALPVILFILLSLPFDRIKTLIAKLRKTEGKATFE
jgi:DNA-binding response OmpR family regulator